MVRVISQETYDDLVKENIEEFEMSPEDAIKEAVAQLEAQGVDLSNIIKDLALNDGDNHLVTTTTTQLNNLWNNTEKDINKIIAELNVLKVECSKDIARKIKAGKDGAYKLLIDILDYSIKHEDGSNNEMLTLTTLDTLFELMDLQPDLLDQRGSDLIKRILDDNKNDSIIMATLKWASVCCVKHESNRQMIFGKDVVSNIKSLLKEQKNTKLLSDTLQLVRRLTLDDDVRVEFGKAHEHAREIAIYTLDSLVKILKENTKPPLVSEIMLTMSTVMVRSEFCQAVADGGGADLLYTILKENYNSASVVAQAFKLITALAGNDDVKRLLVKNGIAPIIISILNQNMKVATLVALGLKCVAALTLREPTHSLQFIENEAPECIVEAMSTHPDNASIQKNACWAIRNMVARCREQNVKFLELGAEKYLNIAYKKFEIDFGFDIKSALRDLECDVKLEEQWTGKGVHIDQ